MDASPTLSFFQRSAERMIDNGYAVIPIAPGQKFPGQYVGTSWQPMTGWRHFGSNMPSDFQVGIWKGYPDAGVGIPCGTIVGIDIDILADAEVAQQIEKLAREMLGDTPLVRIGNAPKRLLVYRTDAPFAGTKKHPIEVLAEGQQFVAYGIHPDTEKPYTWPDENPSDVDISRLPLITEEMAHAWAEAAFKLIPEALRPRRLTQNDGGVHVSSGDLPGDPEAITSALACIPNPDLPYNDWIGVGMAIKGALGGAGEELFYDWSDQSSKNHTEVTERAWASFRPHSKGAGSIYYLAEQSGWVPPAELDLNPQKKFIRENPVDISGLLKGCDSWDGPESDDNHDDGPLGEVAFPDHIIDQADGLLGMTVDWMTSSALYPHPALNLGNAIALLGALYGRRYEVKGWGTRTNIMIVGVAPSSSGKNHSRTCSKKLLMEAEQTQLLMGDSAASGPGLIDALVEYPSRIGHWDEYGLFLSASMGSKAPTHIIQLIKAMMELYSDSGSRFQGAQFSTHGGQKDNKRRDIVEPNLCIYGSTTETTFLESLSSRDAASGFLNRHTVIWAQEDYPARQKSPSSKRPPTKLVKLFKDHAGVEPEGVEPEGAGNLTDLLSTAKTHTMPVNVNVTEEAEEALDAFVEADRTKLAKGGPAHELWGRATEQTLKVAMISAISAEPDGPVITLERLHWARDLIVYSVERMTMAFKEGVADTKYERDLNTVLGVIKAAGVSGIRHEGISGATRELSMRERNPILEHLREMGDVLSFHVKNPTGRGRGITMYFHKAHREAARDFVNRHQPIEAGDET